MMIMIIIIIIIKCSSFLSEPDLKSLLCISSTIFYHLIPSTYNTANKSRKDLRHQQQILNAPAEAHIPNDQA